MKCASMLVASLVLLLSACGGDDDGAAQSVDSQSLPPAQPHVDGEHHEHADGEAHSHSEMEDHEHVEVPLGTHQIGDLAVELAQGHGGVAAGKESHLVVALPYSDAGETVVRAWIGSEDRTLSYVGKGEYAAAHDDYDVHATAPDPLPQGSMWWIELEKPDGTKLVGSAQPLFD